MTEMLELSDWEFKTTMINMLKSLMNSIAACKTIRQKKSGRHRDKKQEQQTENSNKYGSYNSTKAMITYNVTCLSVSFKRQIIRVVQFSHSVVSNSLRPHEPQHSRPPCPSPTARVYPNLWPLSW